MTFEESLARLEQIVAELEGDEVELDHALRLFEEGIALLRGASGELARVEERVRLLGEEGDGTFFLTDFEG